MLRQLEWTEIVTTNANIIHLALSSRTEEEAESVQRLIERAVGRVNKRPVGDKGNNHGIFTASGSSYDHKSLEVVTNMQDAVIERLAMDQYKSLDSVPYSTPREAATNLMKGLSKTDQSAFSTVTIDSSGKGTEKKSVTLVMRDLGCGIGPVDVPRTIFQLGAGHKDGVNWLQGTFGMGGATTYANAKAVVLVTRRAPSMLNRGEEDRITVAVVQWERQRTTQNAFYLVTKIWSESDPATWASAVPFSIPASDYPAFEAGTHLSLIGYESSGLSRRSGDEKSFDTVINTRLFSPVIPIQYRNNITRPGRPEYLYGLEYRLDENPAPAGFEGADVLPFNHNGRTYRLPIRFRLFASPGDEGQRRNFVAYGHALLITSNGQVHAHWDPKEFRQNSKLNKLYNRILVVVAVDELPIEDRSDLFTADRAQMVQQETAKRLEREIAAFIDQWPALVDANNELIRESIAGNDDDRPTIAIAQKIARAFRVKGFSFGGTGSAGGGGSRKSPAPMSAEELYDDPTHFEGPESLDTLIGKVKSVYFKLNAKDDFLGENRRGQLIVTCDHPDIGPDEITVGELRSGRIRVSLAIPENADLGEYVLNAEIPEWIKVSGGLGPRFEWTTKITLVEEVAQSNSSSSGSGKDSGKSGSNEGNLVALIWREPSDMEDWDNATVGEIEMIPGSVLASKRSEYKELANVDSEIPTIILNNAYSPLKNYIQARATSLTDVGTDQAKERYAIGAGVALLVLDQENNKASKAGVIIDDGVLRASQRAAARGVLSVLPEYDRLAKAIEE